MDQRSDHIRQDIESTRASLDDKLDALETKARQTFDLNHQVAERPWMALGAAVAAGYVLGSLGGESDLPQRWHGQPVTTTDYNQHAYQQTNTVSHPSEPSATDRIMSHFDDEIEMLKSAAISTITTMLHDAIRQYVPQISQQMDRLERERGQGSYGASQGQGSYSASRTPSTAPNASYSAGAGRSGFDSPVETTSYGSNRVASDSPTGGSYYPPGATATDDDMGTSHLPSESARARAIGDERSRA